MFSKFRYLPPDKLVPAKQTFALLEHRKICQTLHIVTKSLQQRWFTATLVVPGDFFPDTSYSSDVDGLQLQLISRPNIDSTPVIFIQRNKFFSELTLTSLSLIWPLQSHRQVGKGISAADQRCKRLRLHSSPEASVPPGQRPSCKVLHDRLSTLACP